MKRRTGLITEYKMIGENIFVCAFDSTTVMNLHLEDTAEWTQWSLGVISLPTHHSLPVDPVNGAIQATKQT